MWDALQVINFRAELFESLARNIDFRAAITVI